jgi:hypothetical protein
MTYYESYLKCKTLEELLTEVENDIALAIAINNDRLPIIKNAAEEVIDLKFKESEVES